MKKAQRTSRFFATALAIFLSFAIVTAVQAAMAAQLESSLVSPLHTVIYDNKFFYGDNNGTLRSYNPVSKVITNEAIICAGEYGDPENLTVYKNKLYFAADGCDDAGQELWRFDAATGVASRVADIYLGTTDSLISRMAVFDDKLFFGAASNDGKNHSLYSYDADTGIVKNEADVYAGGGGASVNDPIVYNGKLYFYARGSSDTGYELWSFNGSTASLAKDINTGTDSSYPQLMVIYNNKLYFTADGGDGAGKELWSFNSVGSIATRITDLNAGSADGMTNQGVVFDNKLFFSGNDGTGIHLFAYDGSSVTKILSSIWMRFPVVFGEKLYYTKAGFWSYGIQNQTPTDIDLSASSIAENAAANTAVGTLSTTDPDSADSFTYTLVTGEGDTDNASFNVSGSSLRATNSLDYETDSSYSVRVRSTDQGGLYYEEAFTVTITNVNDTPSDISLSASTIAENAGANAAVGAFSTSDPDTGNTFTYTLVTGTGDTDNGSFNISGSSLRATGSLNYETKSSYSIRLRTTDQGGLWFEEAFTITVTNINETPTNITLSSSSIAENAGANAVVGALTTTDPDSGNTFTYTLVTGAGDTDNGSFNISGGNLRATGSFNYETKSSYFVRVRSTDQGGLLFEKALTISVTNVNETPTDISLSASSIAENSLANAVVGALTTTDTDAANTFTYTLVTGTGDTDNGSFNISGSSLRATAAFNFETKSSYSVRVRSTDQGGLYYEETFTITVTNVNETPTDITLSSSTIAENTGANAIVGALTTTDPDTGNTFTYTIVTGAGDTDNASFNISGSNLRATGSLNFETKSSYSVRVRSTDQGGLYYEEAFTILVTNVNETPTNITLSSSSIAENTGANANVGTLSTTDPDSGNTFTYTLVSGTGSSDNASFNISGSNLRATNSFDYETKSSYSIRLRSTDQGNLWFEKQFTITVTNVKENATVTVSSSSPTVTGQAYTTSVIVSPASGAGTPSGSVTVSDGTSASCVVTLSAGSGSCSLTSTSAGSKTLTASYVGDTNWNSSSGTTTHAVDKANSTTTITAVSNASTLVGEPYSVSVSVAAAAPGSGTPGGTVTVSDDDGNTCTITLSGGSGSCNLAGSLQGVKTIKASYGGNASYQTSWHTTSHTVTMASTTTTITADNPDPTAPGETVTLNASVAAVAPSTAIPGGTVRFYEGTTLLCSAALSGGSASCTYGGLSVGVHTITAEYGGSTNAFNPSTATSVTHTVQQINLDNNNTSTTFTDIGHFSTAGLTDTFTYTLQTSGRICTGTNGAGNSYFEIDGSLLKRKPATAAGTYSICAQSTDSASGVVQAVFSVTINAPPSMSDLSLNRKTVSISQSDVGTLSTTGGWDPQVFSLESSGPVCTSANGTSNSFFEIDGLTLKRKSGTPAGSYAVCIQVKDANDEIAQWAYTITVTAPPADLTLSRNTISTVQTIVGTFSLSSGQSPYTYTFQTSGTLCDGTNGGNNGLFAISGDTLQRNSGTTAGSYAICVQVEDTNLMKTQQAFTIKVTDPPAGLTLSNTTITTAQTIVGTLATVQGQIHYSYTLENSGSTCDATNAADNAHFEVEGNALKRLSSTLAGTYQICLQTEDANQETFQRSYTVEVSTAAAPLPTDWTATLTSNKVIDGDGPGTRVGTVVSSIPGTTFQLVGVAAFPLENAFNLSSDGILTLAVSMDIELLKHYPIRILATSPDGRTQTIDVVIVVMENGNSNGAVTSDDTGRVIAGGVIEVDVLANDLLSTGATNWASLEIVQYPANGTARIGSIIYTPNPGFVGTDFITYRACDNLGYCVLGELTLTVNKTADTIPETGFSPNLLTTLAEQPANKMYADMDELSLNIPSLGVDVRVVGVPSSSTSWDITWLGSNSGWLQGSAYPTWDGNSVLTGHNYNADGTPGIFYNLENMRWGDKVTIQSNGQSYVYEVRQVLLYVDPSDVETLMTHKETPWLTLVTCRGYDEETDTYRWRTLVRAVLVKVE